MLVGWESMSVVLVPILISSQGSENNANIWFPSRNYWNGSQGKYLCVCNGDFCDWHLSLLTLMFQIML